MLNRIGDELVENESFAIFLDGTYNVTDDLRLIAGVRYNDEEVKFQNTWTNNNLPGVVAVVRSKADDTDISGRVGLQYDLSNDIMSYFTYTRGYKGPAVNDAEFNANSSPDPISPETADAYEVGFKSVLVDGRLIVNAAAFFTEFKGLQIQQFFINPATGLNVNELVSAGETRTSGVEINVIARLTDALTVTAAVTVLDAEVTKELIVRCFAGQTLAQGCNAGLQDLDGETLPNASDVKYTVSVRYEPSWGLGNFSPYFQANFRWQDDTQLRLDQNP